LQDKHKKNLFKVLFIITILLSFTITLVGCNWFAFGLLNIFDPQAQIRIDFNPSEPIEGCFNLGVSSINEVEFFITGFSYDYHGNDYQSGEINIPELSRKIEVSYYVKPSSTPGTSEDVTLIEDIPLYVQDVADYSTLNPFILEINCDIDLIGVDGAGHNQTIPIVSALPVIEPGVDVTPPEAVIIAEPTSGNPPLTVAFDASGSTDARGIASYKWDFGDGTTSTEIATTHTYENAGTFIVTLTVTDLFGNKGIAIEIITVGTGEVGAVIITTPSPATGFVPFTVGFDASGSTVSTPPITNYVWDFNDGTTATGITAVHKFTTVGTYLVQLTVTDSAANKYVAFVTVIANKAP
jgi:PKD repeat protein